MWAGGAQIDFRLASHIRLPETKTLCLQKQLSASSDLSARLRPFASDTQDEKRDKHLDELCKLGGSLNRQMKHHPADWSFGGWHDEDGVTVVFPSLSKGGIEVRPKEVIKG